MAAAAATKLKFRSPAAVAMVSLLAGLAAASTSAEAADIAVVAPQSGPYALLGSQIIEGAKAAAAAEGEEVTLIDESCAEDDHTSVATAIISSGAEAAIGFLCSETLATALPELASADIPAISVSVRWKSLMEDALKHDWPFYRLAPAPDDEGEKVAKTILTGFADRAIALIDDGTIHGRELVDDVRNRLETGGLKPVFVDTFRPGQENQIALVRRLQRAGATHVFVGGDRNDVATIARDAAAEKVDLTLIGGDSMRAANRPVPLPDGVDAVALPDYRELQSASAVVGTLRESGIEPEGYVLPAYAAVQIVGAAQAKASGKPLASVLTSRPFDTVIGKIAFAANHELADNPYRLQTWRGDHFELVSPPGE